jgi:hypothetical protein
VIESNFDNFIEFRINSTEYFDCLIISYIKGFRGIISIIFMHF